MTARSVSATAITLEARYCGSRPANGAFLQGAQNGEFDLFASE
jgi:hypothetical protein